MTTLQSAPALPALPVRARLDRLDTLANLVTLARTAASVTVGLVGVATDRWSLLALAYAVYWIGDIADGWLARRMGQATRLGAVLDIVSDRACTFVLCVGVVAQVPQAWPVAAVFLLTFGVLDTLLSLSFCLWEIDTPNDFWRVDAVVYRWNWSPPAKALNTAAVVLALVAGATAIGLAVALGLLALKVWSAARVVRLVRA